MDVESYVVIQSNYVLKFSLKIVALVRIIQVVTFRNLHMKFVDKVKFKV